MPRIEPDTGLAWYRVPVLWLAALCLLASLLGCWINIRIALEHAEGPLSPVAPTSKFQLSMPSDDG